MGYNQINYFSNPRISLPELGPLGEEDHYDMARYVTEQRHSIAARGDESEYCAN